MNPPPIPSAARPPALPQEAALDPRRYPYRSDLAAAHLAGTVVAERYAEGVRRQVVRPAAALRRHPVPTAGLDTEVQFGETLTLYEEHEGWAWVQLDRDGYVGYLALDSLSPHVETPTHRVRALGTFVYSLPDIKSAPLMHLSFDSRLAVKGGDARFAELATGGFVVQRHIAELTRPARDFVAVGERFVGTAYLWGGRTRLGLDCSGLLQLALAGAGIPAPRDSDMQEAELGQPLPVDSRLEGLARGDLVFWKGHVGIMTDGVMLLHANAHHMEVVIEPLVTAAERAARAQPLAAGEAARPPHALITSIRRLGAGARAEPR
jgi:cell wall-associated NlpC family hydrolase